MCFPFVVSGVSWRQANSFVHNNDCSSNFFLSFILSLQEKEMIIEYDGVPHRISSTPYLNVVPPFVVKNTIKVSARQEVFFRYDGCGYNMMLKFGFVFSLLTSLFF